MKTRALLLSLLFLASLSVVPPVASAAGHEAFAGIWMLNREKSEIPRRGSAPEGVDQGGRRGGGGRGGYGGGGQPGGRGGDPDRMRAVADFVRTTMAASDRLTMVVHDSFVRITDADGATLTLQTDNKKADERVENGLVRLSRKSHWDGSTLVSEIEIEGGPKIERKYELSPGGTELHIATKMSGGFGGRSGDGHRTILQVYERPLEQR